MVDEFLQCRESSVPAGGLDGPFLAATVAAHLGGVVDGESAVDVLDGRLGTGVQHHVQRVQLSANGGPVDDRVTFVVQQVDFGPVVQQVPQHGPVARNDGQVQRRVTFLIRLIDQRRIGLDQQLSAIGSRIFSAIMQGRLARPVTFFYAKWLWTRLK